MPTIEKTSAECHEGDVTSLVLHGDCLFSAGADSKIRIWDTDLNLLKTVNALEAYILAIAVNSAGKLYASCSDGQVKSFVPPYDDANIGNVHESIDVVQAMYCDGDVLYTGDDKGGVTKWVDDRIELIFNLVEEVKSLACEKSLIYTVRSLDVVVTEIAAGKAGKYWTRAVFMGKSPLALLGPVVEGKHTFVACADRTGMGLQLVKNLPQTKFVTVWDLPDCHEMIVNAIAGNDELLFSGGYDKKVKAWTNLDQAQPKSLGDVDVGTCVNAICCGSKNVIYVAGSDGYIRKVSFV